MPQEHPKTPAPSLLTATVPWWSLRMTLWAVAVFVLAALGYFYFDRPINDWTNELPSSLNHWCSYLTHLAAAEWALIPLAIFYGAALWARRRSAAEASFLAFVGVAASGLLVDAIKVIAARYRPGMLKHGSYGFEFFRFGFDNNSFPSGHAATAAAVAAAVWLAYPRWRIPAVVLATGLAMTRIIIRAHFFSDVVVGAFLGVVVTLWMRNVFARVPLPGIRRCGDGVTRQPPSP